MPFATHPGSLLRRELKARELSANRLALDLSVRVGGSEYVETALADARLQPSQIVWRRWSG